MWSALQEFVRGICSIKLHLRTVLFSIISCVTRLGLADSKQAQSAFGEVSQRACDVSFVVGLANSDRLHSSIQRPFRNVTPTRSTHKTEDHSTRLESSVMSVSMLQFHHVGHSATAASYKYASPSKPRLDPASRPTSQNVYSLHRCALTAFFCDFGDGSGPQSVSSGVGTPSSRETLRRRRRQLQHHNCSR